MSGRQQITKIGDNYSNLAGVNFGVPQGSILGPLLFTLYINDLANTVSPDSVMFLYADDSAVFTRDKSVEDVGRVLNRDMVEISKWLQVNCLTLNTNKTKCMLFGSQAKLRRSENNLHVVINNTAIDNVTQFKYLGVWMDQSLTWSDHIDKLSKKVNKRLGVLRRVKNVLPQNTLNLLYKTLILPHFDYCDAVWGNSSKTLLDKLEKLQNSAGRIILGLPRRSSTDFVLSTMDWITLEDRRTFHLNVLVYKSLTFKLPPQLCNCFIVTSNAHSYNTRSGSHGNLVLPFSKTKSGQRKFVSRGVEAFNALPTSLKSPLPPTLGNFKSSYRSLLI